MQDGINYQLQVVFWFQYYKIFREVFLLQYSFQRCQLNRQGLVYKQLIFFVAEILDAALDQHHIFLIP